MNSPSNKKNSNKSFWLVMKWSGALLIIAIFFGLIHRLINPVELHLDEGEYIEKVFIKEETKAWNQPQEQSILIGTYDAGSILYVIDERNDFLLVRPLVLSKVDSVWIFRESTIRFSRQEYERYLYEEERRSYGIE